MDTRLIEQMEITGFLTWEFLGTFAGSVIAVTVLTQVIKKYIHIDPKWIALVLSLTIMLIIQVRIDNSLYFESFAISIFNAIIVTGVSISTFEVVGKNIQGFINKKLHEKEGTK